MLLIKVRNIDLGKNQDLSHFRTEGLYKKQITKQKSYMVEIELKLDWSKLKLHREFEAKM
jgi:hypothetical protein